MRDTIIGWHFVGDRLRDGRPVPKDGKWLVHDGPVAICRSGLHGSRHPFDALQYAPGPILCRCEFRRVVAEQKDKFVAHERRIIERADATEALRYFARLQALSVIHLWQTDPPDVVLDYLMTGDESIRSAAGHAALEVRLYHARGGAATSAANAAARAAEIDAAWAAAWATAAIDTGWADARADFGALVAEAFNCEV
jgi:hypothetical protein